MDYVYRVYGQSRIRQYSAIYQSVKLRNRFCFNDDTIQYVMYIIRSEKLTVYRMRLGDGMSDPGLTLFQWYKSKQIMTKNSNRLTKKITTLLALYKVYIAISILMVD